MYRVFFFNWASPLDCPPQICLDWPPPKFSKCWNHIHFARHLDVFRSKGGPVWDSDVFFKSVTYQQTISKFREAQLKKTPCTFANPLSDMYILGPSVVRYLQRRMFKYKQVNSGMINLTSISIPWQHCVWTRWALWSRHCPYFSPPTNTLHILSPSTGKEG